MVREYLHNISDVEFEDARDKEVPAEYLQLYAEYCGEIDILPVSTPMWRSATPEYKNVMLEKSRHIAYTRSLLCSGNPKAIQAAQEAMLNQLGRYYESYQQEKLFRECRKNLEKLRKENPRWIAQK